MLNLWISQDGCNKKLSLIKYWQSLMQDLEMQNKN